jgi:hypothetical protein
MRELKYYIACTVDSFIAYSDGSFDFFPLLFSGVVKPTALELTDSKIYSNGFMLLRYRVKH